MYIEFKIFWTQYPCLKFNEQPIFRLDSKFFIDALDHQRINRIDEHKQYYSVLVFIIIKQQF
jgi:hypothetical protein